MWGSVLNSFHSGHGPEASSCERLKEPFDSMKYVGSVNHATISFLGRGQLIVVTYSEKKAFQNTDLYKSQDTMDIPGCNVVSTLN